MSAPSFRGSIQAAPENWQSQLDYWIYLTEVFSGTPTPNPRGRASLSDGDGWMGGANYGFASLPAAALPSRPSVRVFHIDAYPGGRTPTLPTQYNWSRENESRLSQEEQKQAVNKLRKQLYNPHISNIIRRLGSSKSRSSDSGASLDEDGKRCAVCLEDFETKQFVTVTPCNHLFHEDCIVPWLKSNGNCPVCRFRIAEQNEPPRQRSSGSVATSRHGANPLRF